MADEILPPDGCAFVPVGKNHVALVDADMLAELSKHKWHLSNGYAVRASRKGSILMHRIVNRTPGGMETDHINRVRLDNRRCNLRTCTRAQNAQNIGPRGYQSPEYKGVCLLNNGTGQVSYRARIQIKGRQTLIGIFGSAKEAAQAYDSVARDVHGEFAVLNFP